MITLKHTELTALLAFTADDDARPGLQNVKVDGKHAYAADGHCAVRLRLDAATKPMTISGQLLEAAESLMKSDRWRDDEVRIEGPTTALVNDIYRLEVMTEPAEAPVPVDGSFAEFFATLEASAAERKSLESFRLQPKFVGRWHLVMETMDFADSFVQFYPTGGPHEPIWMEAGRWAGVIMPWRMEPGAVSRVSGGKS